MKNRDIIIFRKILDYCAQLEEACNMFHNEYNTFVSNSVFQNACCMCILQIGELCKAVSEDFRMQKQEIPWKEWCGIRDVFAHQYSSLDHESAWSTIQHDLPELKTAIDKMLKSNEGE